MNLPCRLITIDDEIVACVSDLSYGGLCATLPEAALDMPPRNFKRVEIDGLGAHDVIFRWQSGDRIGLSFRLEHAAHPKIEAFFAAKGISIGARAFG